MLRGSRNGPKVEGQVERNQNQQLLAIVSVGSADQLQVVNSEAAKHAILPTDHRHQPGHPLDSLRKCSGGHGAPSWTEIQQDLASMCWIESGPSCVGSTWAHQDGPVSLHFKTMQDCPVSIKTGPSCFSAVLKK